jgi:hypothetical protein
MLVIYFNGRGWRAGWLLGFAAQCWLILFGALGAGPWTFVFSAGPAVMFAANWWLHPRRVARRLMVDAAITRAAILASHEPPSPIKPAAASVEEVEEWLRNVKNHFSSWGTPWHPVCTATRSNGHLCLLLAVPGEVVCRLHLDRRTRTVGRTDEDGGLTFVDDPLPPPRRQLPPPYSTNGVLGMLGSDATVNVRNVIFGGRTDKHDDVHPWKLDGRYPYGGWVAKRNPVDDEQPVTHPAPGMSTDIRPTVGDLGAPPQDPPGGCLLCPGGADVPQTELIGHLISHHPDVYDGTPFETWPVDDITGQEGDKP